MFLCGDSFGFLMAWKVSLLLLYGGEKKGEGEGMASGDADSIWDGRGGRKAASAFARCGFERTIRRRRRRNPCSRLFVPSYAARCMDYKRHLVNQFDVPLNFLLNCYLTWRLVGMSTLGGSFSP